MAPTYAGLTMSPRPRTPLERQARAALGRLAVDAPAAHEEVADTARDLVIEADLRGDALASCIAWRVIALVERGRGDLEDAVRSFEHSLSRARVGGFDVAAAESRISLAGLFAMSGQGLRALSEIDGALAGGALTTRVRARAVAQRGTILADLGRFVESLAAYEEALPALRAARDTVGEIVTLNSRSGLLLHLGRFADAEADLLRAERLQRRLGGGGLLIDLLQNLGEVTAMRGDLPGALRYHDLALEQAGGHESPMAAAHRIDVLLAARLVDEAGEAAERALASATIAEVSRPEIELRAAETALLAGDPSRAHELALAAAERFARQGRRRWVLLARQVGVRAALAGPERDIAAVRTARSLARALERTGWTSAAAETRLAAAETAVVLGWRGQLVQRDLEAAAHVGAGAPAQERLRAARAEALLGMVRGDRRTSRRALRRGLGVLDAYRAALGATELRAHASAHGEALAMIGVRMAVADDDVAAVLDWSERWRAATLQLRPVRPPDDDALADDLAGLRRITVEIDEAAMAGADTSTLIRHLHHLEQRVRATSRHAAGDRTAGLGRQHRPPTLAALRRAIGDRALVSFIGLDGTVLALSMHGRRVSVQSVGSVADMTREVESLRFSLRRLSRGGGSRLALDAARASVQASAAGLDALLFAHLGLGLGVERGEAAGAPGDEPACGSDPSLVVVPTGPLHALPWSLLPTCRARPVTVAPSISFWCDGPGDDRSPSSTITRSSGEPARAQARLRSRALLVAGPGLEHAEAEIAEIAALTPGGRVLAGPAATAAAVSAALPGAGLAHLACHGRFRSDNPMFSSLVLADGPLFVYDLERLGRTPETIVLSACDSGLSAVRSGEELMGLAAALFSLGTRHLVASVVPVPDDLTRTLMSELHRELRAGRAPEAALARARQAVADDGDRGMVAAAAFVCLGRSHGGGLGEKTTGRDGLPGERA